MKNLFIINPIAGKGRALNYIDSIKNYFKNSQEEYIIEITKYKNHGTEIAKDYTSKDDYRVFALGGDGTINEVLNGMYNSNSTLCVIPNGTGNDFARTLYKEYNLENILHSLINGQELFIDIAKCNNRYFLNIASVGFDAKVVNNAKLFKKKKFIPNSLSYIISLFYTTFGFSPMNVKIEFDNNIIEDSILLLAACNGKFYGGGIPIAPKANITDGFFDLCLVKSAPFLRLITKIPKSLKGDLSNIEEVNFYNSEKVYIKSEEDLTINIDGEIFFNREVQFEIIKNGLKVMIPKNS